MKPSAFCFAVLLSVLLNASVPPDTFAQQGWYLAGPGSIHYSVAFPDTNTAFSVGGHGRIYRSLNGGATWSEIAAVGAWLRGVSFANPSLGIAVGDFGMIARTDDGGTTWVTQASGTNHQLFGVTFATPVIVFAVGGSGTVLRSVDAGITWEPLQSNTSTELRAVSFSGALHGVAVGGFLDGAIVRTSDGGSTWIPVPIGDVDVLYAVAFCDAQRGVAAGLSGSLLVTSDGGQSWALAPGHTAGFFGATCKSSILTVAGSVILRSTNFGLHWLTQPGGGYSVAFANSHLGLVAGNGIYRTTMGGNYGWIRKESGTTMTLRGVSYMDQNIGVAVGDSGTIIGTTDGGNVWIPRTSGVTQTLNAVVFSTTTGIAVGNDGLILRTVDGGAIWTSMPSGTSQHLLSVSFSDHSTITVGGAGGTIRRSTDNGLTWTLVTTNAPGNIFSISFANPSIGYALAVPPIGSQRLLRTSNGGLTWTDSSISYIGLGRAMAVFLTPSGAGYIVGRGTGIVLRTTNFGESWLAQTVGVNQPFNSVLCLDEQNAVIVGDDWILRTTDGGETWEQQGPRGILRGVAFSSPGVGTAVGGSGAILWTGTDGVYVPADDPPDEEDPGLPTTFVLEQNYPNPFNLSTMIRYSLPRAGYVELRIFNTLGQSVATLIADERTGGVHTVSWEARSSASGVYFYRMIFDGRVATRKLLLLR